ncbi:hypothetical protein GO009_16785 [Muricauda sp. TY007]|uniref:DUF6520 family protein n=1 Tax=Allomuricauda sp. TY007 TaxID=2683200 RepID=UPI0013BFEB33|nr:DUF6520 family protein [Muricauda sp. TY007]NDV17676.1 hypothetical protein [Muricauda sp. TY007]
MKSKFLKLVLPAIAIIMAVGLAFATEESNLMQPGYKATPDGPEPVETDCVAEGEIQCTSGIFLVYLDEDLSIPLYERNE